MERKPLCSNNRIGDPVKSQKTTKNKNNKKLHVKFYNVCESIDNKVKRKNN